MKLSVAMKGTFPSAASEHSWELPELIQGTRAGLLNSLSRPQAQGQSVEPVEECGGHTHISVHFSLAI